MNVTDYCQEKYLDFYDKSQMSVSEKDKAGKLLTVGYAFIAKKVTDNHGDEITPTSVRDIALLEGFLITFIQHAIDKDQLQKIGAIIG